MEAGDLLRDLLKDADVHTMGMLLESGASGSLHMTFDNDVIRKALQQPLPSAAPSGECILLHLQRSMLVSGNVAAAIKGTS